MYWNCVMVMLWLGRYELSSLLHCALFELVSDSRKISLKAYSQRYQHRLTLLIKHWVLRTPDWWTFKYNNYATTSHLHVVIVKETNTKIWKIWNTKTNPWTPGLNTNGCDIVLLSASGVDQPIQEHTLPLQCDTQYTCSCLSIAYLDKMSTIVILIHIF